MFKLKLNRILAVCVAGALPLGSSMALAKQWTGHPRISMGAARTTAMAQVSGRVIHQELEKEHGRWIYSFEIRPIGERGKRVKEVNIDANTGQVLAVETEHG